MVDWKLYVPRGIMSSDDGSFDSSQIAAGLDIDLLPQIVLPIGIEDMSVLDELYDYLSGKGLSDIPLKITGHNKKPFISENCYKIFDIFDNIHRLNEGYGKKIITDVISTVGAVHSISEELELRKTEYGGYDGVSATFTAKDYYSHLSSIKANMLSLFNEASRLGIPFIFENSAGIDYGFTEDVDSKSDILKSDPRWGKTGWLPERLQTGDLGCAHDLAYLTNLKRPVCINIEDLNQTAEYSRVFNLQIDGVADKISPVSGNEQSVLDEGLGVFVRQGCPIYHEKPVNPIDVINMYAGQIPICEIGGQVSMFYDDGGMTKIGSHMPITFGDDPNGYISDDGVRRNQNEQREALLTGNLKALHGSGCRKGVLNIYLGPDVYTGSKWREYHELSRDNVLSIIDKF